MAVEDHADNAYHRREPGWYVINRGRRRAVAGPYGTDEEAAHEKGRRDAKWAPHGMDALSVALVSPAFPRQELSSEEDR